MKHTIWGKIPGYNYTVSIDGNVYSLSRTTKCIKNGKPTTINFKGRHLKLINNKPNDGYPDVKLSNNGKVTRFRVHRLVATVFISDEPKLRVNHMDFDGTNNTIENLEWVTTQNNALHALGQNYKSKRIQDYKWRMQNKQSKHL